MRDYIKGRGAQHNPHNSFAAKTYERVHSEGIDDWEEHASRTNYTTVYPKSFVNKVESPDLNMLYSANPYQGCEHGCTYCYARNSHEYWGYSAGLDFETKLLVKVNAPDLFREYLDRKQWDATPISFSGNTDCYQPLERKFKITRQLLQIACDYGQPISIITKNSLVCRDLDILQEMAKKNLCNVFLSINSLTEATRQKLEPRTATAKQRLSTLAALSKSGIPTGIMCAPVVPGLTDHEIPQVLKAAAEHGARRAGYTVVRLNGQVATIFEEWLKHTYPLRAEKIWHQIQECHSGKVNNSTFGERIQGTGILAKIIQDNFILHCKKNGLNVHKEPLERSHFKRGNSDSDNQLSLF